MAKKAKPKKYTGKIVVLNKDHGARENTKRAKLLDAILTSKTVEDARAKSVTFRGSKVPVTHTDFRFALDSRLIRLAVPA
jgi:hypothetical protein